MTTLSTTTMVRPDVVKIALVGNHSAGKTSLLNSIERALLEESSSASSSVRPTEGMDVRQIDIFNCLVLTNGQLVCCFCLLFVLNVRIDHLLLVLV